MSFLYFQLHRRRSNLCLVLGQSSSLIQLLVFQMFSLIAPKTKDIAMSWLLKESGFRDVDSDHFNQKVTFRHRVLLEQYAEVSNNYITEDFH